MGTVKLQTEVGNATNAKKVCCDPGLLANTGVVASTVEKGANVLPLHHTVLRIQLNFFCGM